MAEKVVKSDAEWQELKRKLMNEDRWAELLYH